MVSWRTKDRINGYLTDWDGTWTHFGCEPREWDRIEYLQIKLTPDNQDFVLKQLKMIHVPGIVSDSIVTIFGYRQDVDYI